MGACQVVVSFLEAIEQMDTRYDHIECHVPRNGPLANYVAKSDRLTMLPYRRFGPKAISRLIECLLPSFFFEFGQHLIVLGDVPLRAPQKQVVLVHQPNLQSPRVNRRVGRTLLFRIMRAVTRINARYADCVISQTAAMASGLRDSYQDWADRDCVKVVGQPPPSWFTLRQSESSLLDHSRGLRLFYPATDWAHKNHKIFENLGAFDLSDLIDRVVLTLPAQPGIDDASWLSFAGQLDHAECLAEYKKADALIFPSFLESYGLPLVEAMVMGLPIVVADLPYARVLCGDEAIYFDPDSPAALVAACKTLRQRLLDGWRPDWSARLEAMPKTWTAVVQEFLDELEQVS